MSPTVKGLFSLLLCLGGAAASAQISYPNPFKHVVVIVQENRTPDNLFGAFLTWPGINPANYDIATSGLALVNGQQQTVPLTAVALGNDYDPSHMHYAFVLTYHGGKMDRANYVRDTCNPGATDCTNHGAGQFLSYKYVENTTLTNGTGLLDPYFKIAAQYGWANRMFQTNQGPSFPAHQFLFGGTSAPSAADDASGIFVPENPGAPSGSNYNANGDTGCLAPLTEVNWLISPSIPKEYKTKNSTPGTLCFSHKTLASLLDAASLSWKYYTPIVPNNPYPNNPAQLGYNPGGSIWTAPNSIYEICQPDSTYSQCTGLEWAANVDLSPPDVLKDIGGCKLPAVSWVIPSGGNSDHPANPRGEGGPSWVASVVNAIGNNSQCDQAGYWSDTAILITWDDWGGWYDHVAPPILSGKQGVYQYGFRVPLLVVSAYTPQAYVSNVQYDFGSIVRFIEGIFNLGEGSLGFADARAGGDLQDFFKFTQPRRTFQTIAAPLDANFFLHDPRPPEPPDTD